MKETILCSVVLWQISTLMYANGFPVKVPKGEKSHFSQYIGCYSKGCTGFEGMRNKHGAILTSSGLPYKWVGVGAGSTVEQIKNVQALKKVVLYLGRSCDAYSKLYGKGTWSWANGGFIVEFENERFGFGRQELDIERDEEFGCSMQ